MTTRTAAEEFEEALERWHEKTDDVMPGVWAMDRFLDKHADTLRAALAQPQEGEPTDTAIYQAFDDWAAKHANTLFTGTVTGRSAPFYLTIFRAGVKAARLLRATQSMGGSPNRENDGTAEGRTDPPRNAGKVGESPAQSAPGREWPAKLRLTELLREAANALEACHAANEDLLSKRAAPPQDEARELLSEARHWLGAYADADPLYERILAYLEQHK